MLKVALLMKTYLGEYNQSIFIDFEIFFRTKRIEQENNIFLYLWNFQLLQFDLAPGMNESNIPLTSQKTWYLFFCYQ